MKVFRMSSVSVFRCRSIRRFLLFLCLILGIIFMILSTVRLRPITKDTIKTAGFHNKIKDSLYKNKFDTSSYLMAESNMINKKKTILEQPRNLKNEKYNKIDFIPKEFDKEEKYKTYGFNIEASYKVPFGRKLPDTRQSRCRDAIYDTENSFSSSIIITFHNEARSALLRTVMSILLRTPHNILEDIILVDDNSDNAEDGSLLSALSKVQVIRNEKTEGVARSRIRGAREAMGDVLIFLNSHCEVNTGWLEPLVELVTAVPKALVSPAVDRIDKDDFEYEGASTYFKGGFDWSLHFKWIPLTFHEMRQLGSPIHPYWSPVVAGGIFAVNREWFFDIGTHDEEFHASGVEDLEISLKSWLCGGSVYICPCSRIGHVFMNKNSYDNSSNKDFIRNSRRVAEVWMDDYKIFYYQAQPLAYDISMGSLEQPKTIKENMECKPFRWYLEGLYPELKLPTDEDIAYGQIRQGMRCLAEKHLLLNSYEAGGNQSLLLKKENTVHVEVCDEMSSSQQGWTYGGRMKTAIYKANKCLTAVSILPKGMNKQQRLHKSNISSNLDTQITPMVTYHVIGVALQECNQGIRQKWARQGRLLYNDISRRCLEICHHQGNSPVWTSPMTLCLGPCSKGNSAQQWEFTIEIRSSSNNRLNF